MLKKLLIFLLYLIGMIPIISLIVAIYWVFNQHKKDTSFMVHPNLTSIIYMSAFFTFFFILCDGINSMLFFIPNFGGSYDDNMDWQEGFRTEISIVLGLLCSAFIFYIFGQYGELLYIRKRNKEEIERLKKECQEVQDKLVTYEEDEDCSS